MKFAWTVAGECFYEGSSDPWRPERAEGTVEAEDGGEALEKIIHGIGVPLEDSIPWDLIDLDREVTITIKPVPEPVKIRACAVCDEVLQTVRVSGGSGRYCPRCQRIFPPGELERARALKRLAEGAMDVIDQAVSEGKLPG